MEVGVGHIGVGGEGEGDVDPGFLRWRWMGRNVLVRLDGVKGNRRWVIKISNVLASSVVVDDLTRSRGNYEVTVLNLFTS